MNPKHTNDLIHESSPYLLQHAHNPVDWMPWGDQALDKAKKENKPLLISIGYAACHWCHVMERESFEDQEVAKYMNEYFVCIKVDREERPDIDQVYMDAVQLMNGQGGWPLNCFATPDGRPFYGGTYFPKQQWIEVLKKLHELYLNEPEKVNEYADKLTQGVNQASLVEKLDQTAPFSASILEKNLSRWKQNFDPEYGGNQQAPKFPLPNNYEFLLQYQSYFPDEKIKDHLELSLKKMAYGGLYDQLGGGFARYSTDMEWKVPHFEKMLYDNAQLVSLYSKAYQEDPNPLYKQVVEETIQFVNRELKDASGAYHSSLDADSEGVEGKFYVWSKEELKEVLGEDYGLIERHYNINSKGAWEGNYILLRDAPDQLLAKEANLSLKDYQSKINELKKELFKARSARIRPGLDDKCLTSWNALMIQGLCDAYLTFGNESFLEDAIKNALFISKHQLKEDGGLYHNYHQGKSSINGYLEDYCFAIEAFTKLYLASFDEQYLTQANLWVEYCLKHFYNPESGMFYFTSSADEALISRKTEFQDNVIPASNSSMAKALHQLGLLLDKEEYIKYADQMLVNVQSQFESYLPGASNWAMLLLNRSEPFYEVAVVGQEAKNKMNDLYQGYFPHCLIFGSDSENSKLPLLQQKWINQQTTIYVCENKSCRKPTTEIEEAIKQLNRN